MSAAPVKIVLLYQSLLGIYGDHGNAVILTRRLQWRGIDAELVPVEPGDPVPTDGAVYLMGGGEDIAQTTAVHELKTDRGLFTALDNGAVLFAVCAGYQICGKSFTIGARDEIIDGLGLLDIETRRGPERAVGESLSHWTRPDGTSSLITGFENHGGWTQLGSGATPLTSMEVGWGNGDGQTDGAVQGRVYGIYPHGPVLSRNPDLADHLLETALGRPLEPLDMPEIEALRARRIEAVREGRP
ncbi:glutamine amidotransferase [Acidipropionibacterium jensenii]|uniref:type 1 glutamine amidotransferase n=1 Tax=Acidipropionibacterium jensenii TaxID=1749 RepID=UPI00110AC80E|nr:glutamine amidotransferase [Acidipropionibacterium jensenii]QCV88464.1 glutamine amidotransferase [Acidipropionibacterium jensenii]